MGLWMLLLLLHFHLVLCVFLPAPFNISISSFNMEHTLRFLPGPQTPSDATFTVQVLRSRKNSWRPVAACLELKAGQTCNLTKAFKDPFDHYRARVQAVTPSQTSNWTVSGRFQPVSDTVLGPPDLSVSGCGNCLVLQLRLPAAPVLRENLQLRELYREFVFHVQRTRDGTQFTLNLPYEEETVITYLQPGVEYCVTVSVTSIFNSNTVPSKPQCAFTSPPSQRSSLSVVFSLVGVFSVLVFLLMGLVLYGSQLSFKLLRQRIPRTLPQRLLLPHVPSANMETPNMGFTTTAETSHQGAIKIL
ncbi:interleukin-20 receptor subunit alpha-like [Stegastes partitus]|uniref:Interleukin-20 receptor subunit alpha-like n=1 Tax=Stegastes partitus TaxID=144197 RepID=A0A3B4ZEN1_9TELE|nr:PREDICTED: interleukin-20 receptor subunit alpha-like [Stegastes partitus]